MPHVTTPAMPLRTGAAVAAGATVAALSRRLGRGGGSVVGGRATLALDPRALERLAAGRACVVVSGTNGKTTTTSLLRSALATTGPVVTNLLGANLPPGITAALAGGPRGATAALEVDEAWLGKVVDDVEPQVAILLNLSRDQLDRNNEVRHLAATWRSTFADRAGTTVVANADDPLVAWAAGAAGEVVWVGAGQPWTADASGCPNCGARITFDRDGEGADPEGPDAEAADGERPDGVRSGAWACSSCALHRPDLDVRIAGGRVRGPGFDVPVALGLPGRANVANAALALTAAVRLGADPAGAVAAMAATTEVVGRYRCVDLDGVRTRLLLSKNPAGWLEVLDVLGPPPRPVVVAINARTADGRDPSWLWDVPFERLAGRPVVATGERSRDLAVRLRYAEVDHTRVDDLLGALDAARAMAAPDGQREPPAGPSPSGGLAPELRCAPPGRAVDVVANYTAFQQLRSRLGERR